MNILLFFCNLFSSLFFLSLSPSSLSLFSLLSSICLSACLPIHLFLSQFLIVVFFSPPPPPPPPLPYFIFIHLLDACIQRRCTVTVIAQPDMFVYNAVKGGVAQLTRCLALDLAKVIKGNGTGRGGERMEKRKRGMERKNASFFSPFYVTFSLFSSFFFFFSLLHFFSFAL